MALDQAKNRIHGLYKGVMEYVTPVAETSQFTEKGVLTPEEFLKAGCQLVYKCPTWSWEGGDPTKRWKFLPENQQYLLTRNVPCLRRVAALQIDHVETVVEDGEWLSAFADHNVDKADDKIDDIDEDQKPSDEANAAEAADAPPTEEKKGILINVVDHEALSKPVDDEDESESFEEIPDMEEFDDADNVVTAADVAADSSKPVQPSNIADNTESKDNSANNDPANSKKSTGFFKVNEEAETVLKTRTYDISITFDKYYRVPRVWLRGYDENSTPLTSQQIMEDISADHAHKTVTVESHPHTGVVSASIHPCRHSEVMKIFMDRMESASGKGFVVDQYLFLFLKFMSAVIPTIEYDYTHGVDSK